MTEQELRQMVRHSIARARGSSQQTEGSVPALRAPESGAFLHASHARLPVVRGGDDDGACLIEPAVRCNHCGFCQSYGH
jgi:hypothetical protein